MASPAEKPPRTCLVCGASLDGTHGARKVCSAKCAQERNNASHREHYDSTRQRTKDEQRKEALGNRCECGALLWPGSKTCTDCLRAASAARKAEHASLVESLRRLPASKAERRAAAVARWAEKARPAGCSCKSMYCAHHQAAREVYLAAFRDGDLCARCGEEMHDGDALDLDHADSGLEYLGLAHHWCNRATSGPRLREGPCEVCGKVFKPKKAGQRSCSRKCGARIRKWTKREREWGRP